jgi:hypothetical protein
MSEYNIIRAQQYSPDFSASVEMKVRQLNDLSVEVEVNFQTAEFSWTTRHRTTVTDLARRLANAFPNTG